MYLHLQFAAETYYDYGNPVLKFGYYLSQNAQNSKQFYALVESKYHKTTVGGVEQKTKKNNIKYYDRSFEMLHQAIKTAVSTSLPYLNENFIRSRKHHFDFLGVNTEGEQNSPQNHGVYQYVIRPILDHYEPLIFDTQWAYVYERIDYPASIRERTARSYISSSKREQGYNPSKGMSGPTLHIGNALTRYAFMVNETKKTDKEAQEKLKETEKKEDIKMPVDTKTVGATTTIAAFTDAFKHGAKVAAADEAANAVLGIAETIVGDSYPELAKTENGKIVAKLLAATLLHYAAGEKLPFIPEPDAVRVACNLVIEAGARDLIQPKIAIITPCVTKLAEIGKQIAAG